MIALRDQWGEIYFTVKKKDPFGGCWAWIYPITKVGHVILNEDGSCSGKSSYIKKWVDI